MDVNNFSTSLFRCLVGMKLLKRIKHIGRIDPFEKYKINPLSRSSRVKHQIADDANLKVCYWKGTSGDSRY